MTTLVFEILVTGRKNLSIYVETIFCKELAVNCLSYSVAKGIKLPSFQSKN